MKKSWVNVIVKNITFEVAKELNIEMVAEVESDFNESIDYNITGKGLLKRSMYVRYNYKKGYTVSFGSHSPGDTKSDTLQTIIGGRIAERLFIENLKT